MKRFSSAIPLVPDLGAVLMYRRAQGARQFHRLQSSNSRFSSLSPNVVGSATGCALPRYIHTSVLAGFSDQNARTIAENKKAGSKNRPSYYFGLLTVPCENLKQPSRMLVPRRGLEPPHLAALVPETSASTNSATWARGANSNGKNNFVKSN